MKKKHLKPTIVLCLVAMLAIAGTLAYLTDATDVVTNTFTPDDDIDIYITETTQDFTIIPGQVSTKDPEVNVEEGSAESYVFVVVTEEILTVALGSTDTFASYVEYDMASGWVEVSKTTDTESKEDYTVVTYVYAYATSEEVLTKVDATSAVEIQVLKDDKVTTPTTVTQEMILSLGETTPTLSFQAYAIQTANITDESGDTATFAEYVFSLVVGSAEYGTLDSLGGAN